MKKVFAFAVGAAVIVGGMTYQTLNLSAGDKVKVCHRTGNGNAHVIEISSNAVQAHLNHGDSLIVPDGAEHGDPCDINPPSVNSEDVEK